MTMDTEDAARLQTLRRHVDTGVVALWLTFAKADDEGLVLSDEEVELWALITGHPAIGKVLTRAAGTMEPNA